jgi:hypothetical protein
VVRGVVVLVRLKALVVVGDGLEDYGDLLAVGRAEAKRLLRTHENVNVKDILYSAKCGVHIIVFETPRFACAQRSFLLLQSMLAFIIKGLPQTKDSPLL